MWQYGYLHLQNIFNFNIIKIMLLLRLNMTLNAFRMSSSEAMADEFEHYNYEQDKLVTGHGGESRIILELNIRSKVLNHLSRALQASSGPRRRPR